MTFKVGDRVKLLYSPYKKITSGKVLIVKQSYSYGAMLCTSPYVPDHSRISETDFCLFFGEGCYESLGDQYEMSF